MKWVALVARVLVGGMFVYSSVAWALNLMPPQEPPSAQAGSYLGALVGKPEGSPLYMQVVKACEFVDGLLVLSGRFTPVGLVLVTPVAVNIALFEMALAGGKPGPGVILTLLCVFLVWAYRRAFAPVFAPQPVV